MTADDRDDDNGRTPLQPQRVGYGNPPLHTRFKPNTSGNPSGRPARSKLRNVRQSIVDVYMQEVSVGDGRSKRKLPAIVVLHEQLVRSALKGSEKAAALAAKFAAEFHVNDVKDEVSLDLTRLTSKERDILRKAGPILQKAKTVKPT